MNAVRILKEIRSRYGVVTPENATQAEKDARALLSIIDILTTVRSQDRFVLLAERPSLRGTGADNLNTIIRTERIESFATALGRP